MIELRVVDDAPALARTAATEIATFIGERPDAVLLAATGNTPMGCYAELARLRESGDLDASRTRVVQLDDYLGLEDGDPRSLFRWMERALLIPLGIERERTLPIMLDGDEDPELACRAYEAQVEALGGIDLAILGLGRNGHLGFNEPPSSADAPTRVVSLTPESLESNAAYWSEGHVPERAVTAGMSVILAARRVLVLVSGAAKAPVLARLMESGPDSWLPASHLHLHPDASILADREAAPTTDA